MSQLLTYANERPLRRNKQSSDNQYTAHTDVQRQNSQPAPSLLKRQSSSILCDGTRACTDVKVTNPLRNITAPPEILGPIDDEVANEHKLGTRGDVRVGNLVSVVLVVSVLDHQSSRDVGHTGWKKPAMLLLRTIHLK